MKVFNKGSLIKEGLIIYKTTRYEFLSRLKTHFSIFSFPKMGLYKSFIDLIALYGDSSLYLYGLVPGNGSSLHLR